ncbi:MFS transporter [Cupriavidus taiwanensis]|uniref:MFS transporter n=1 Tax=Cupriavidus taiwanensis TaxID=164546 RepID=UPI00254119C7|nr:MFS transporter [Cupriavidus taiwanensis]MDK3023151.1 MFS transporter [Cupriavidus taiwanensis]
MSTTYRPATAWRIAILLFLFMAVNFLDKIVVGLLAVPMMEDLDLTPAQFGLVASSFFWLFAISGVVGGFISNRVATTGMLMVMALGWSLFQIPMALSSSLAVLVLARVLLGVAEGPAFPVAVHACYKWFPDDKRAVPVAFFSQGGSIGLLLAGIAIPLITAHWGWRANFYVLSAVGLGWVLLWIALGREGAIGSRPARGTPETGGDRVPYRRLLSDPTVLACFLLHFVAYWGLALTLTWLPAYLQRGLGFSGIESGRLFAMVVAINIPVAIGTAWLAQRMLARGMSSRNARGRFSAAMLMLAGAAFVGVWTGELPPLIRVALIGLALGVSPTVYSLGPAMLAEVTPASQRGAVLAFDNSIASLAGVLAPLVSAYFIAGIGGADGYQAGFALCGAIMVCGGVLGALLIDPEKSARAMARHLDSPMTGKPSGSQTLAG